MVPFLRCVLRGGSCAFFCAESLSECCEERWEFHGPCRLGIPGTISSLLCTGCCWCSIGQDLVPSLHVIPEWISSEPTVSKVLRRSARSGMCGAANTVLIALGIDDTCCWEFPLWGVAFRISFSACCSHWAIAMRRSSICSHWAIAMRHSSILVLHCHCMGRAGAVSGEERMWTCLLVQCRTVSASGPWLWSLLTFAPSTIIVTTVVPGRGDMSKILELGAECATVQ